MSFRDVSICVTSHEPDHGLIGQAVNIAEAWGAHLSCCAIGVQPVPISSDGILGTHNEMIIQMQAAEDAIQGFRKDLGLLLQEKFAGVELRESRAYATGFAEIASVFARYADMLIARMADHPDKAQHGEIIEGALFGGGRPVLALPKAWKPAPIGHRVLFAWDASREASRAIHDALPLLADTAEVCIVTIDAQTGAKRHGDAPGLDIATHLARHGLKVSVRNEDSLGKPIGERLVETAKGFDADLIVMGAYRHPKLAQRLTGGPTQFLIAKSPIPVFLSH